MDYILLLVLARLLKPMHVKSSSYKFAFALACLLLTACQNTTSHGNADVTDLVTLTDALRREGATVIPIGPISQPFLSVTGIESEVNGESVQIFEYLDNATLKHDAANIQSDGTVKGMPITWAHQPHFYQAKQVLVIYDGNEETVLKMLETTLGQPFAVGKLSPLPPENK